MSWYVLLLSSVDAGTYLTRVHFFLRACWCLPVSGGSSNVRGWLYHSDGRCTNFISGERVETGMPWGENSTIGITACYDSGTVTFYNVRKTVPS